MVRDELSVLSAFLAVAEERSFTRAAKRLLAPTTRSVAPTDAGEQIISRLRPALGDIRGALDRISGLRDRPAGRVRLLVPRLATMTVLAPSRPTTAGSTLSPRASTRAFISGSSSNRTWL